MDKWISHPTSLKIISVILGLLLWAVVHIDPETSPQTVTSNVDTKVIEAATIVPVNMDRDKYVLTAMEPTVTRLVVEGRISVLRATSNDQYVVELDMTNVKPGIHEIPLRTRLPKGIKEIELSPRVVTVQVEEIVTQTFEAQVLTEGRPAEGYVMGNPQIVSEGGGSVQVTLPRDDMDRVGVVAATLDIAGAEKTVVNKKAKLVVYDAEGREIPNAIVEPDTIHAEVKVTRPFKQVPLQIRYTGSLPEGLSLVSVQPEINEVTVYARQERLDELQIYDGAVLDLSIVKESGQVRIKAPPLDGIEAVEPGELTVNVTVEPAGTKTFRSVPIALGVAAEGLKAELASPAGGKIDVTLSGSNAVLDGVTVSDIRLVANVSGLGPGEHEVLLEADLPPYVQLAPGTEQSLVVKVNIAADTPATSVPDDVEVGGTPSQPADEEEGSTGEGSGGEGHAPDDGSDGPVESDGAGASNRSGSENASMYLAAAE
jgi:Uncharacterized protein conserved in bacteria